MKKIIVICVVVAACILGLGQYILMDKAVEPLKKSFPEINEIQKSVKQIGGYRISQYNRVIFDPSKTQIQCPAQNDRTGVLLALGQSNIANSAEYKISEKEVEGVITYINGRCYKASSPMLGGTGLDGEWISFVAKKLIDNDVYDQVVIAVVAIGGVPIIRWSEGYEINPVLKNAMYDVNQNYEITDIIWHHGESDVPNTSTQTYIQLFNSVLFTIRERNVDAPIFLSKTTLCYGNWAYPNEISKAQEQLISDALVVEGVDTDALIPIEMRDDKDCHFKKQAQIIASENLARIITELRNAEK